MFLQNVRTRFWILILPICFSQTNILFLLQSSSFHLPSERKTSMQFSMFPPQPCRDGSFGRQLVNSVAVPSNHSNPANTIQGHIQLDTGRVVWNILGGIIGVYNIFHYSNININRVHVKRNEYKIYWPFTRHVKRSTCLQSSDLWSPVQNPPSVPDIKVVMVRTRNWLTDWSCIETRLDWRWWQYIEASAADNGWDRP